MDNKKGLIELGWFGPMPVGMGPGQANTMVGAMNIALHRGVRRHVSDTEFHKKKADVQKAVREWKFLGYTEGQIMGVVRDIFQEEAEP